MRACDNRIIEVGPVSGTAIGGSTTIDLGDVALLPRLVNAHTHLEFSDCQSVIGRPGIPLADWIGKVISTRQQATVDQRRRGIEMGLAESVVGGVGLIGDIATTPSIYPAVAGASIVSFAEVLGLSADRGDERFEAAIDHADSLSPCDAIQFGISPHAPYSTPPSLVRRCVETAKGGGWPVAMHLAESPDERELLQSGTGRFADALHAAGLWRDSLFPWSGGQAVRDLIDWLAAAPRSLLIHGNDLNEDEIQAISRHQHMSVVYCPRTHDFFGYAPHPVRKLLQAGVRVAIGTDSRASNPDLSIWKEVQFLLNRRSDLDPHSVLDMATRSGADALLGAGSKFGRIEPGTTCRDSLVSIETTAENLNQVWRDFAESELLCTELPGRA